MQDRDEDPKLREVKAVLRRLQRISVDAERPGDGAAEVARPPGPAPLVAASPITPRMGPDAATPVNPPALAAGDAAISGDAMKTGASGSARRVPRSEDGALAKLQPRNRPPATDPVAAAITSAGPRWPDPTRLDALSPAPFVGPPLAAPTSKLGAAIATAPGIAATSASNASRAQAARTALMVSTAIVLVLVVGIAYLARDGGLLQFAAAPGPATSPTPVTAVGPAVTAPQMPRDGAAASSPTIEARVEAPPAGSSTTANADASAQDAPSGATAAGPRETTQADNASAVASATAAIDGANSNGTSNGTSNASTTTAAPPVASPPPVDGNENGALEAQLREAGRLLDSGQVTAARSLLLELAGAATASGTPNVQSPDVALLLGRTYDPSVLRNLAQPDAQPSTAEAERWYRLWHERAVAEGLVRDTMVIDHLLRQLR